MKRLLFLVLWFLCSLAQAQFVPGQVLTASELNNQFALYAPLAGGATFTGSITSPNITATNITATNLITGNATTNGFLDNSTLLATDQFVKQSILATTAEIPISNFTGGTWNFATAGTGARIVVLVSGGVIQSVLTVAVPGSGYQVGDCLVMIGGNGDAILRVTGVSAGGITSASIAYGGTGYITGSQLAAMGLPPGARTANLSGTLTSNALIIIPSGTYLQGARRVGFNNNTVAGGFTITVKLSNGAGGSQGTGVVLPVPTNGANSASLLLYTDGQNDVWAETGSLPSGNLPLSALASQTANTVVANATGSSASPTAIAVPSCSTSSSALNWTTSGGASAITCNTSINAAMLGSATFASPPAAGYGSATPEPVAATTISATGLISPSSTVGIKGTVTNDNAQAGSWGEYTSNSVGSTSLSNATTTNIVTLSLTAGDWDVSGVILFTPTATFTNETGGISTTSVTFGGVGTYTQLSGTTTSAIPTAFATPVVRVQLTTTTTVYLVGTASFASGTATTQGFIRARRVR